MFEDRSDSVADRLRWTLTDPTDKRSTCTDRLFDCNQSKANICSNQAGAPMRRVIESSPLIAWDIEIGT
ncbi:hypothetical protein BKG69_16805 [Mycobacteroides chelonae]|uniref:Uncharacterized protein n=1 Tax=Mycobacteroides chelonae TaxID=1774 RepID=A0A0E3XQK3_MYCCH|nr:hypothetical protein GR01_14585 [Mycobacteroides chelonae]KRQ23063.1 hypothetical protein AOT87_13495 [Mycobacteroides sp. H003]KRQ33875.1 hypothetical protein AOT91_07965 [Mycobacteroides sp. H092]KRQ46484.1 hypothetical protein AOT88_18040 [Mycobacteroides sp. H063]KRQ63521.1 hypothetical protein AOT94_01260 [Mycobacteroides sp. HXVII]KRQ65181.1 hypothetical protein AOT90_06780 [Mycobacteroides sp. H079]KRQ79468.1 hypothetical protein AOT95_16505 [Mycobacteroides sp. HXXIII]KRQ85387.1 h